ncbi:MAG: GMC family oxidoreductase [Phycisphaerales bacterium]
MPERYDVIIIGTGAGGGTLLHRLASTGKRILVLERGDYVPREADNWNSRAAVLGEKYHAKDSWRDAAGRAFRPGTHYNVGGNTKFYGAALFRMRESDFGEVLHEGGLSPAWPISYDELEPYYAEAESLYEVRGRAGADPTEPRRGAPYAFDALPHEPRMQELHDHFERVGLRPFHVPLGVRLDPRRPHASPCVRCRTCDGFPCLVNAKSDAQTMCVDAAARRENVTLLVGAKAERLLTSADGRVVTGVVARRAGALEEYSADVVVVSCGAVNSAALLLRSTSARHPNGLANSSGLVGRHYMAHNNSVLFLFSTKRNPTLFQKTLALNDFYHANAERGAEHPLGHISMVGKFDGAMFKAGAPPFAPTWLLERMGDRSLDFWLTSEDLPDPENRVTLDGDGSIRLSYRENNLVAHRELIAALKRSLATFDRGRWISKGGKIPLAGVAHQCGTLRFGADPKSSVLDVECKTHDVDNLYVVDASFFPSSSAVNPALTIMANALRVGDRICERLGARLESHHARPIQRRLVVLA